VNRKAAPAEAAPQTHRIPNNSSGGRVRQPRWWDNPGSLDDDELLLVVRSMLAVDRAVDSFRRGQAE
jgi:hypothetical protein